jgi:hypothetical protein
LEKERNKKQRKKMEENKMGKARKRESEVGGGGRKIYNERNAE